MMQTMGMRIAGHDFSSRLILGTGGFPRLETLAEAIEVTGTGMVTVALRRMDPHAQGSLMDVLDNSGVAVAIDGEVVPRGEWSHTTVQDEARVEVVMAVQGG